MRCFVFSILSIYGKNQVGYFCLSISFKPFVFWFFFSFFVKSISPTVWMTPPNIYFLLGTALIFFSYLPPPSPDIHSPSWPPSPGKEYNARIRGISESMTPQQSDRHRSYSFSGLSTLPRFYVLTYILFKKYFPLISPPWICISSAIFPFPLPFTLTHSSLPYSRLRLSPLYI